MTHPQKTYHIDCETGKVKVTIEYLDDAGNWIVCNYTDTPIDKTDNVQQRLLKKDII